MEMGTKGQPPQFGGQWVSADHEMKHFCINRHNGSTNFLFMDWSIRKVGLKELWTLKWHREYAKEQRQSSCQGHCRNRRRSCA